MSNIYRLEHNIDLYKEVKLMIDLKKKNQRKKKKGKIL